MNSTTKVTRFRGFSLIELLVTLSVAGILMGVAAPSFRDAMNNSQQSSVYNALVSSMRLARSESIKRSSSVSVCARVANSIDNCGNDWDNGWLVFTDEGATPGAIDGGETVLRVEKETVDGIQVSNKALLQSGAGSPISRPFIRFGPRGTSNWRGSGSYQFCDKRGTDQALALNVTLSGDVRKARRNDNDELLDAFQEQVTCP